jgi:hypothetical protein
MDALTLARIDTIEKRLANLVAIVEKMQPKPQEKTTLYLVGDKDLKRFYIGLTKKEFDLCSFGFENMNVFCHTEYTAEMFASLTITLINQLTIKILSKSNYEYVIVTDNYAKIIEMIYALKITN